MSLQLLLCFISETFLCFLDTFRIIIITLVVRGRVTCQTFHSEQSVTPPSASVHPLVHGGERQQPYQLCANGHRTAW